MDFICNNSNWRIELVSEDVINNATKRDNTLGCTMTNTQTVLILESQPNVIKTLKHELTHVWLYEFGHNPDEKQFNDEDICEIISSINDFINDIINRFKKEKHYA